MAVTTQLVGKLGGGLDWDWAQSTSVTAPRPMLLRVAPRSMASIYLTLSGQKTSLITREVKFIALNTGDSASGLPRGETEYAYLD